MKSVIALGLLACSGLVQAAPVTVSFDGYSSGIKNDNVAVISTGEKQYFTTTIDFDKCSMETLLPSGELFKEKGDKCGPDHYIGRTADESGPVPFSTQTWVYAKPDGSYIYTYQTAHGWQTTVFRANSYKVVR